jgi:hypothetical protein
MTTSIHKPSFLQIPPSIVTLQRVCHAGCTFRHRTVSDPYSNGYQNNVGSQTYFENCTFKGSAGTQATYVSVQFLYDNLIIGVAFDNCTFQMEGLREGQLPVRVFASHERDESGIETATDHLFSDPPLEVGVITQGTEEQYYELDDGIPARLRVKVGPNLDKAQAAFGVLGTDDDPLLRQYKASLVRPHDAAVSGCCALHVACDMNRWDGLRLSKGPGISWLSHTPSFLATSSSAANPFVDLKLDSPDTEMSFVASARRMDKR